MNYYRIRFPKRPSPLFYRAKGRKVEVWVPVRLEWQKSKICGTEADVIRRGGESIYPGELKLVMV